MQSIISTNRSAGSLKKPLVDYRVSITFFDELIHPKQILRGFQGRSCWSIGATELSWSENSTAHKFLAAAKQRFHPSICWFGGSYLARQVLIKASISKDWISLLLPYGMCKAGIAIYNETVLIASHKSWLLLRALASASISNPKV